ncbi:DNA repair helicase XPB [Paenibacillus agilis]|uniref:DNA repair helicase XPB n=1 Tax=Paenibacillus agilis TaxID=3020863 RepID=UPI00164A0AA3|nr:DNA repair helicase XPB [Paenibacillus agilis]
MSKSAFELAVQPDMNILVHDGSKRYDEIREELQRFSSLVKHPQGIHTFKMTPLTLWNAAASGRSIVDVIQVLDKYATWAVPMKVKQEIAMWMDRYGLFVLEGDDEGDVLILKCAEEARLLSFMNDPEIGTMFIGRPVAGSVQIAARHRGRVKRELARVGYPVIDRVGYNDGEPLQVELVGKLGEYPFSLRPYQNSAVEAYIGTTTQIAGDGIIVLPCGAGKTVVGIGAIAELGSETLIVTSNATSVKQWKQEILSKTTLSSEQIGEYTSQHKQVRPITITTYQMMTYRRDEAEEWVHMGLFHQRNWGLIIYDEVHLLPAPVFRTTADLQATRRLGLTATLIREDGCERDVFSLIGPKRFELPWKELERQGWIASVACHEIRVPMDEASWDKYRLAASREKARIAAESPEKMTVVERIVEQHAEAPTLIIGQYLDQLHQLAQQLGAPLLTGATKQEERERLYKAFRKGEARVLVVSKVANFAVDLPDATVAIQVSGTYGSRQEEAQRLGRLLRPKEDGRAAYFYTVVSSGTREVEDAMKRQLFLVEQGYQYAVSEEGGKSSAHIGVSGAS